MVTDLPCNSSSLSDAKINVVNDLKRVFSSCRHHLWSGKTFHASPYDTEVLKKVRSKGLKHLNSEDLNALMFGVLSTLGSVETLKFLLPRFFESYFCNPRYGWTAEPWVVASRLLRADFESWPAAERKPTLEALIMAVQQEIELDEDDSYLSKDNLEAQKWARAQLNQLIEPN